MTSRSNGRTLIIVDAPRDGLVFLSLLTLFVWAGADWRPRVASSIAAR